MSGNLLEKYTGRGSASGTEPEAVSEPDGTEDLGAFGWLRGPRERSLMLELRKKNGNLVAIAYGFIDRVEFDPGEGITLYCGRQVVRIKGRNLNSEIRPQVRLFQGITRHRVPWITEADQPRMLEARENSVVITEVEW